MPDVDVDDEQGTIVYYTEDYGRGVWLLQQYETHTRITDFDEYYDRLVDSAAIVKWKFEDGIYVVQEGPCVSYESTDLELLKAWIDGAKICDA